MTALKGIWIEGWMPMQLLFILTFMAASYVGVNFILNRMGKRIPAFPQFILLYLGTYAALKYIIFPPIPEALLYTYMGLVTIVLFLLISVNEEMWSEFKRPIANTLMAETPNYRKIRMASFVGLPLLAMFGTYNFLAPGEIIAPIELRTVHPAPPRAVTVEGINPKKKLALQTVLNPYRIDDEGEYLEVGEEAKYFGGNPFAEDAPKFMQHVREGGSIFFQNCHFCHGDNLNGRGMFAFAFNPIPANFVDPGTIAQLQEAFVFWRVAKGGPGLPAQSSPWDSAMPPWEQHLTIDEMWKVIMFEYWHTEFFPRTWE